MRKSLVFTLLGLASMATGLFVSQRASAQPPFRSNQRTFLLFSYVTNQNGQDTGLEIANTTLDPYGTSSASGACTLLFYGQNAPGAPVNTPMISAGTTYATSLSVIAPHFQGYIIANCGFPLAHGVSFVSDSTAQQYAAFTQAMVLPPSRNTSFGEQLAH
jgi:hypothetical protein